MLTTPERRHIDAIGGGAYDIVHRDSIEEVVGDVRARRARAVVLSVARCHPQDVGGAESRIASIVRDFPRVTTVALLSDTNGAAPAAVLSLGRCGIRTLVDARRPEGWRVLRDALVERADAVTEVGIAALARLTADLVGAPPDCHRFFATLFTMPASVTTVQQLAGMLTVLPTTLISRFARRGLPSAKLYLCGARIIRAAALFEDPATSIAAAAIALEYSSPQSFSRHLALRLGMTGSEFRRTFDGLGMVERFRQDLVIPYLPALRRFSPLDPPVGGGEGCVAVPHGIERSLAAVAHS
jgi:AraC-like DNA-binding protein